MADLIIKPRDVGRWKDGDIVLSFNDHRISCEHAFMVCLERHPTTRRFVDFIKGTGYIANATLLEEYYKLKCLNVLQRLTRNTARLTRLSDDESFEFTSNVPYENPWSGDREHMDIDLYIKRRLKTLREENARGIAIFGTKGKERWYGGNRDVDAADLDSLWSSVEDKTAKLRADPAHNHWPLGDQEKRTYLGIQVDDFTDAESDDLMLTQKVNWSEDLGFSAESKVAILDRSLMFDKRDKSSFLRADVVRSK